MARPDKAAAVAELTEGFRSSSAVVLTEYRGLTVAHLKELRRSLGENVTYAVVKNTLTRIAAREAAISGFDDLLAGPSAIAFVSGDPVLAAKGLRDFAKAHPQLVIKGGVMDGRPLSPDEIRKLADLESREVLLAMLAGTMKASLSGAVSLFAAPLSRTARLIEALRQKAEQDPSVLRGGSGTPAAAPEEWQEPAEQDNAVNAGGAPGTQAGDPVHSEPLEGQPVSAEPASTEPGSAEPVSAEPASAEPASAEPVNAEPEEKTEG